jgi:O-antigen ligase
MRKIAYIFVWLFCASIPLQELAASTFVDVSGTISRLVGIAATIVGFSALIYDGRLRPFSTVHGVIILYLAWGSLTYLWSADQTLSYARLITNFQLVLLVLLLVQFASRADESVGLMTAYVFGAMGSLMELFRRMASGSSFMTSIFYERFTAFDNNPNDYALALAIAIPMGWYLASRRLSLFTTILGYSYTAFGFVGVILTSSRGGLLAAAAGGLIIPLTMFKLGRRERIAAILVSVVGIGVTLKATPEGVWNRLATLEDVTEDVPSSEMEGVNIRTVVWRQGLQEFTSDAQVASIGVGAGAYRTGVDAIYGDELVAHNVFISILVEQGIVGMVLFLIILGMLFSTLKYLPRVEKYVWIFVLLSWSVGVMFVTWEHTKNTWFILGLLAARSASVRRAGTPTHGFVAGLFRRTKMGLRLRRTAY